MVKIETFDLENQQNYGKRLQLGTYKPTKVLYQMAFSGLIDLNWILNLLVW